MPRTAHPMTSISAAMSQLRHALEGLVAEQVILRRDLQSIAQQGSSVRRDRLPAGRAFRVKGAGARGGPKKRGRAFKFNDEQAADIRKRVESGTSAVALAKELKISLPTMYNTLKRAGWKGRRGRPAGRRSRALRAATGIGGPKKRGRAFKFTDAQAAEFRKQVDGGKSALALAKDLKISLPTIYSTLKRAGWSGRGRKTRASATRRTGAPAKRGRPFRFTDAEAAAFRKRVESGETATAIAKEVKVSLPAIYNTLKRAGWAGRKR